MRHDEGVRFVIEFEVRDVERFREMSSEMAERSSTEDGTALYDWYLDEATGHGMLYEAYRDVESLMAHVGGPVFTEIAPRFRGVIRFLKVDVFGNDEAFAAGGDLLGAPTRYWGQRVAGLDRSG